MPSLSRFAGGDLYHPQQKRSKTDRSIRNDGMKLSRVSTGAIENSSNRACECPGDALAPAGWRGGEQLRTDRGGRFRKRVHLTLDEGAQFTVTLGYTHGDFVAQTSRRLRDEHRDGHWRKGSDVDSISA